MHTIQEWCKKRQDVRNTIERLTAIKDVISQYGISRPMMEACDPQAELVQRGTIGSYEDLSLTPEKGDVADAAVEGMTTLIDKATESLNGVYGVPRVYPSDKGYGLSVDFEKAAAQFESIKKFDEVAFGKSTLNMCDKHAFDKIYQVTVKMITLRAQCGVEYVKVTDDYSKSRLDDKTMTDIANAHIAAIKKFANDSDVKSILDYKISFDKKGACLFSVDDFETYCYPQFGPRKPISTLGYKISDVSLMIKKLKLIHQDEGKFWSGSCANFSQFYAHANDFVKNHESDPKIVSIVWTFMRSVEELDNVIYLIEDMEQLIHKLMLAAIQCRKQ